MGLFQRKREQQDLAEAIASQASRIAELEAKVGERSEREAKILQQLELWERELAGYRLDYEGLYEKARNTLVKLSKRAKREEQESEEGDGAADPLRAARRALALRKLSRGRR